MLNSYVQPRNLILILKTIQYIFYTKMKKTILGTKFAIYTFLRF